LGKGGRSCGGYEEKEEEGRKTQGKGVDNSFLLLKRGVQLREGGGERRQVFSFCFLRRRKNEGEPPEKATGPLLSRKKGEEDLPI